MATTSEGKARSAMNACKHNLTGGTAWIPGEDRALYDAHMAAQFEHFHPQSEPDIQFTRELGDAAWRLDRARKMEAELLQKMANPYTADSPDFSNQLARLTRYSQAIERTYYRAYNELNKCEKPAKPRVQNELPDRPKRVKPTLEFRDHPPIKLAPAAEKLIQDALDEYRRRKAA